MVMVVRLQHCKTELPPRDSLLPSPTKNDGRTHLGRIAVGGGGGGGQIFLLSLFLLAATIWPSMSLCPHQGRAIRMNIPTVANHKLRPGHPNHHRDQKEFGRMFFAPLSVWNDQQIDCSTTMVVHPSIIGHEGTRENEKEEEVCCGCDGAHDHAHHHHGSSGGGALSASVAVSGIFWFLSLLPAFVPSWNKRLECYAGLISIAFGFPPFFQSAARTLWRHRTFNADCMMVVSTLGALALGEFSEAASVSFLLSVGHYLESKATNTARGALKDIVDLQQQQDRANRVDPVTNEMSTVPAESILAGDKIAVRTGERVAADGEVVEGTSTVDQSSLTGESLPVRKAVGDSVLGGSINSGSTQLLVRATADAKDSAFSKLIRLLEETQARRSPHEKLIDRFAKAYTPIILSMAAVMGTVPWFLGRELGRRWTLNGLVLLLLSCPCALTMSTPVAYTSGLAATARNGVVVKGGATLEALGRVDSVLLDKTGTITQGEFNVLHLEEIGQDRKEVLELLVLMETPSSHPLSAALVDAVRKEGYRAPTNLEAKEHTVLDGEGVTASVDGRKVYVGNQHLFARLGMYRDLPESYKTLSEQWNEKGGTVGYMGIEGKGIIASYCITDKVRNEARETIQSLIDSGIDVSMLTGDSRGAALLVGQQVGIASSNIHAQLTPKGKLDFVTELKAIEHKDASFRRKKARRSILFCGDGINDAPVATAADVGVSLADKGAALTIETSDVTLMTSDLSKLPYVIRVGKRTLSTIRENIALTMACKLGAVGLTIGGRMSLLSAVAADVGVLLLVTLNSLKLLPRRRVRQ